MSTVEMWYERHLRMRKDQPAVIRFLLWVGFVKFGRKSSVCHYVNDKLEYIHPEQIIWPFHAPPAWAFRSWRDFRVCYRTWGLFYVFRNHPGVIKWLPGRLLPMRWGFGVCGFEFGDRG